MSKHVTLATWDDVPHLSEKDKAELLESIPEHERDARSKGVPMLGAGRVFPIDEESIKEDPPELARHWPRIAGMDLGWEHPTAVAWLAWDRDADCVHVYDVYRMKEQTPVVHAGAIRARGVWIPVAWPHDGLQHDKGSGDQIAQLYRDQGIAMLPERATWPDGSNGVEAGVLDMLDRMKTGRLKVARQLNEWFEEFRLYHRKDGKLVKLRDDLLSATRYGIMMLREATVQGGSWGGKLKYNDAWVV